MKIIEIYLRGFSIDLNLIEKFQATKKLDKRMEVEISLSGAMLVISEILEKSEIMHREALLTAFSLNPTTANYEKVKSIADNSCKPEREVKKANPEVNDPSNSNAFVDRKTLDFEKVCDDLMSTLKATEEERKTKNETTQIGGFRDGLLAIQGSVLTSKSTYDPQEDPLKPFDLTHLGIPMEKSKDLVVCINAPRWHTLSWLLHWSVLEQRCQELLKNPQMKYPNDELKYLVIDYTQFDEWSTDEEFEYGNGIENGYEDWDIMETSEEEEKDDSKNGDKKDSN